MARWFPVDVSFWRMRRVVSSPPMIVICRSIKHEVEVFSLESIEGALTVIDDLDGMPVMRSITVPSSVHFTALLSRLISICRKRVGRFLCRRGGGAGPMCGIGDKGVGCVAAECGDLFGRCKEYT